MSTMSVRLSILRSHCLRTPTPKTGEPLMDPTATEITTTGPLTSAAGEGAAAVNHDAEGGPSLSTSIRMSWTDTVAMAKLKVSSQEGIPMSAQRLYFDGMLLHDDGKTLAASVQGQILRISSSVVAADEEAEDGALKIDVCVDEDCRACALQKSLVDMRNKQWKGFTPKKEIEVTFKDAEANINQVLGTIPIATSVRMIKNFLATYLDKEMAELQLSVTGSNVEARNDQTLADFLREDTSPSSVNLDVSWSRMDDQVLPTDTLENLEEAVEKFKRKRIQLQHEGIELEEVHREVRRMLSQRVAEKRKELATAMEEQEFDLQNTVREADRELQKRKNELAAAILQLKMEHDEENSRYGRELMKLQSKLERTNRLAVEDDTAFTEFLQELECPVCYNPMLPPVQIFQCRQGHTVCSTCKHNENCAYNCPICRENFAVHHPTRCLLAERIAAILAKMVPSKMSD